ncbi:MAG TPA: MarR family transcriptional regulator [Acidimicrobiales bacterium]|nr:MarR family transcriptional regulator [Acidimicrobiales bacterium]
MASDRGAHTRDAGVTVLLTQLTKAVYRRASEAALGMRFKEFVALAYLRAQSGLTQHELGEAILVDPNNLVILLNELEGAGFALRRRDPDDRRRHLVDITPEGRQALERAEEAIAVVEDRVLATLSATERESLRRLLSRALDSACVAAASSACGRD